MSVSIFIKSWRQDLKWLHYCLRFLEQNWAEPDSEVVVMLDSDCRDLIDVDAYDLTLRRIYQDPWPDGYAHAMYQKACADMYCQGEVIMLLDSDTMLLERTGASYFFDEVSNLPIIPWITYEEHHEMFPHSPWQKVTNKVLKIRTELHFMPLMPILYWASTLHDMRRHIVELHDAASFCEVVYSDVPFDPKNFGEHPHTFLDYDCLGAYAYKFELERYLFRPASTITFRPFKQFHSWSEWNEATPGILDACLVGGKAVA